MFQLFLDTFGTSKIKAEHTLVVNLESKKNSINSQQQFKTLQALVRRQMAISSFLNKTNS